GAHEGAVGVHREGLQDAGALAVLAGGLDRGERGEAGEAAHVEVDRRAGDGHAGHGDVLQPAPGVEGDGAGTELGGAVEDLDVPRRTGGGGAQREAHVEGRGGAVGGVNLDAAQQARAGDLRVGGQV